VKDTKTTDSGLSEVKIIAFVPLILAAITTLL
jgi:hypothetical protein